jgi:hypothetical protein
MTQPIGTRRVSCSAHDGPRQCKAYKNLTGVLVDVRALPFAGSLVLPDYVVLLLCPKHFVLKIAAPTATEQKEAGE